MLAWQLGHNASRGCPGCSATGQDSEQTVRVLSPVLAAQQDRLAGGAAADTALSGSQDPVLVTASLLPCLGSPTQFAVSHAPGHRFGAHLPTREVLLLPEEFAGCRGALHPASRLLYLKRWPMAIVGPYRPDCLLVPLKVNSSSRRWNQRVTWIR
ncbi:hypothetical protein GCM10010104_50720 [Streptomyces indiaensis]|uniref:Uncharacterized protein n=1 Tax=Streptomyces indiaensis TaxID=284033 RepID=A0ABN3E4I4_9ACTN